MNDLNIKMSANLSYRKEVDPRWSDKKRGKSQLIFTNLQFWLL